jgi:hypothetical protein
MKPIFSRLFVAVCEAKRAGGAIVARVDDDCLSLLEVGD